MRLSARSDSRGFALFGAVMIVPVVLAVGLAVIDLSGWNSLRSVMQLGADQIAYQAASVLPDRQAAINSATAAAQKLSIPGLKVDLVFPAGRDLEVAVRLKAVYNSAALRLLGNSGGLLVEREGRAALKPKDTVVIVGLGSSLRPQPAAASAADLAAWGEAADWPASSFFNCSLAPQVADSQVWPAWAWWGSSEFRRWATQSCFNPVLSAVKLTAIGIIDSSGAGRENRAAIIVTPGRDAGEPLEILRGIHPGASFPGGFADSDGEASSAGAAWLPYRESRFFLGDEACALFSDPVSALNDRYLLALSPLGGGEGHAAGCSEPIDPPPCGSGYFPFDAVNGCFVQSSISIRQSLYWRAARVGPDGSPVHPAIEAALGAGLNQLLEAPAAAESSAERELRGNLAGRQRKQLFILTDYLDQMTGSMQAQIAAAVNGGVEVVFAVLRHQGIPAADLGILDARLAELRSLQQTPAGGRGGLTVFEAASADELHDQAGPYLQNLGREVVLRN